MVLHNISISINKLTTFSGDCFAGRKLLKDYLRQRMEYLSNSKTNDKHLKI